MPVTIEDEDEETKTIVLRDDGIRPQTTMQTLQKLKPSFVDNGTTTAGNSSQLSDGASAVLVASRQYGSFSQYTLSIVYSPFFYLPIYL